MKYTELKIAALALVSIVVSVAAGHAESAAIRNCTWCHGGSAQGYTPAPRLAGQRARYIEQQLISFGERTRDSPFSRQYMWGAAANLSPQAAHGLALYFSRLPPRAADDGDRELVARGEAIYQRGMPEANIAACVACHGPNAEGIGEIPRLSEAWPTPILREGSTSGAKDITGRWRFRCRILRASCHEIRPRNWLRISAS